MSKPICIYHGGCTDGWAAAWVVHKTLGSDVEFFPGVYQTPPPDVTNRDVILVDFSYKHDVMVGILAKAELVTLLDHHVSAYEDLKDLIPPPSALSSPHNRFIFDMDRSGAGIAWDYFNPKLPRPLLIDYVEDMDLWRKSLPNCEEFSSALRSYPQDFEVWDGLFQHGHILNGTQDIEALIEEGKPIRRAYRQLVESIKSHAYTAALGGHICRIVNCTHNFASEVANEIIEDDAEFGATYEEAADGKYSYSLRSIGDFSVANIATQFGGGGHKNAAGFTSDQLEHSRALVNLVSALQ